MAARLIPAKGHVVALYASAPGHRYKLVCDLHSKFPSYTQTLQYIEDITRWREDTQLAINTILEW